MENKFYPSEVVLMTPQIATQMLQKNTLNRKLREQHVKFLAKQMVKGQWRVNPSCPIVIADDETIIDGQHRLNANVKADVPVYMCIMRGVDKDDRFVVDTGLRRNAGDTLAMEGVEQAVRLSSIIKSYLSMKNEVSWVTKGQNSLGVTNLEVSKEYHENEDFYQKVLSFANSLYKKGCVLSITEVGGTFSYLVKEKNHETGKVRAFFEELTTGGKNKAISYVRNRFIKSMRALKRGDKLTANEKMVLLSKAWNAFLLENDKNVTRYETTGRPIFN